MKTITVVGNGSNAVATLAELRAREPNAPLTWIRPDAPGAFPFYPGISGSLDSRVGLQLTHLADVFGIETGEFSPAPPALEFRNRAFREAGTGAFPGLAEESCRFERSFFEIEMDLRKKLEGDSGISIIDALPVLQVTQDESGFSLKLGDGREIRSDTIIWADGILELPKGLCGSSREFSRTWCGSNVAPETQAILQVIFFHDAPIGEGLRSAYVGYLTRDAGEEKERAFAGYFMDSGFQSLWTLPLTETEQEDNHDIAKKLRKIRQSCEKMFGAYVVSKLAKYGVGERKSHTAVASAELATNRHFWRGVVDGDGYIAVVQHKGKLQARFELVGSRMMCEQLSGYARQCVAVNHRASVRKHRTIYSVAFSGKTAQEVINHLYDNAELALDRKATVSYQVGLL